MSDETPEHRPLHYLVLIDHPLTPHHLLLRTPTTFFLFFLDFQSILVDLSEDVP
jgi:hypothetical protein